MNKALKIVAFAALAFGAACGNQTDRGGTVKAIASGVLKTKGGNTAATAPSQADLAKAISDALAASDRALAVVVVENRNGYAILTRIGKNKDHLTWGSADKRTITTRRGVITATRGLGFDLMTSDVSSTLAKLSTRQGGNTQRTMFYLSGENQTIKARFDCTLARGGQQEIAIGAIQSTVTTLVESCRSDAQSFENTYQVSPSGDVLQSRQWMGPQNGYLFLQILRQG